MVTSLLGMVMQRGNRRARGRSRRATRHYLDHLGALSRNCAKPRNASGFAHLDASGTRRAVDTGRRAADVGAVRRRLGLRPCPRRRRNATLCRGSPCRRSRRYRSRPGDRRCVPPFRAHPRHSGRSSDRSGADGLRRVVVTGPPAGARALVRSMVCQLAVSHRPDAILIGAVVGGRRAEHWDWLKWLPHNRKVFGRRPDGLRRGGAVDDGCPGRAAPPRARRRRLRLRTGRGPRAGTVVVIGEPATTRFVCISTVGGWVWRRTVRPRRRHDAVPRRESAPAVLPATVPPVRSPTTSRRGPATVGGRGHHASG